LSGKKCKEKFWIAFFWFKKISKPLMTLQKKFKEKDIASEIS